MPTEMINLFIFFGICIAIFFIFRNVKPTNKEGLTTQKFSHGIAGNSSNYSNNVKSTTVKLQDQLLIGKYRTDYENSILHLDDYLNTLMLHTALNIDHTKDPSTPCNNFEKLSTLYNSKQALNEIMKHIDSN